jgi:hypothetical protein
VDDDERAARAAEVEENRQRITALAAAWQLDEREPPSARVGQFLHGLSAAVRTYADRVEYDPTSLRWMGLYLEFWAGQIGKWGDQADADIAGWAAGLDPDAARDSST